MNEYRRALREFQDYADDVTRSRFTNFEDNIRRFAAVLNPDKPLGNVAASLPTVDFDSWYEQQQRTMGGMVGSGCLSWPDDREQRLALQVELIGRLGKKAIDIVQFTTMFMYVRNDFDDNIAEFVQQVFRPFARDFLRFAHETPQFENGLNEKEVPARGEVAMSDELTLFISHSSADAGVAKALIFLFEKALKLPAREIRCTSVDGYRLPVGADTNEQLRREIHVSRAFVGVVTKASLQSAYVLFELGARWGARKHLAPVLARGADATTLAGPLHDLNALDLAERNQVLQLAEDMAEYLSLRIEPLASFQEAVDAVVLAARAPEAPAAAQVAPETTELSDEEVKVLQFLAEVDDASEFDVARTLNIKPAKAQYYLSRLQDINMVGWVGQADRSIYFIEQPGRAALVRRNLL